MIDNNNPLANDRVVFTLRAQLQKQMQLNQMADHKSHILVGLIIIPLSILSTKVSEIEFSTPQVWILAIFIFLELIGLIQGVLVIRPRTLWLKYDKGIDHMPNPFFYGYFSQYSEEDYIGYMRTKLADEDSPGELLLKDIHQIGLVLKRKFLLLRLAYFFAILGFIFAIVSYVYFLLISA